MRGCAGAPLAGALLPFAEGSPPTLHPFEAWLIERRQLEAALDETPEDKDPAGRERLFDRAFALERLLLEAPSSELPAIRAKAEMLTWLMEMDGSDGLTAMRQILAFLKRLS